MFLLHRRLPPSHLYEIQPIHGPTFQASTVVYNMTLFIVLLNIIPYYPVNCRVAHVIFATTRTSPLIYLSESIQLIEPRIGLSISIESN